MNLEDRFPATVMPDRDWWQALWPDPLALVGSLGLGAASSVLDLGCGDGYFTAPLATLVSGRVYALDIDPAMLDQAREEVARWNAPSPVWICGDARQLPELVPEPVDAALMANTFHGVPDKAGFVRAVGSVVRSGGRFVIVNWHRLPREETPVLGQPRGPTTELRMTPDEVRAVVEPAGFRFERVMDLPPYHYAISFVRS